jgi:pyruvate,water dikinase
MIINFKDFSEKTPVIKAGGKAHKLAIMTKDGINVPEEFALRVDFFDAWFKEYKDPKPWKNFYPAAKKCKVTKEQCDALKDAAESFTLTKEEKNEINTSLKAISRNERLAVRSSSPEEDTSSTSFAGICETYLGIDRDNLENSIRENFKSCLDYRIALYKEQPSIDVIDPKIAVVVQSQIDSDVADDAFSLNHLNNSYDEALFTSNFGLGKTVVLGTATPHNFFLDKSSSKLKAKTLGTKEFSLKLVADGTSEEKDEEKKKEFSLLNITDNSFRKR